MPLIDFRPVRDGRLGRHPIRYSQVRTFQNFKWGDMPGALLPTYRPAGPWAARGQPWYTDASRGPSRSAAKSHWDIPIRIGNRTVHFLASHPTPPVFDGDEDRNGSRNFDGSACGPITSRAGTPAHYIYDDNGKHGGLKAGETFVIAGDQNSDPLDGDSIRARSAAAQQSARQHEQTPESLGAEEAAALQGGANLTHRSDPRFDTADFADGAPGNLRQTTCCRAATCGSSTRRSSGRCRQTPLPPHRRLPVPGLGPPAGLGRRWSIRRRLTVRLIDDAGGRRSIRRPLVRHHPSAFCI